MLDTVTRNRIAATCLALSAVVAWTVPMLAAQEEPAGTAPSPDEERASSEEAQTQTQAQFEEEVEVTEVLLDVVVTDAEGNVVVGLGPEDFVVREDGERVRVESATFYSSSRLAEDPQALAARGIDVDLEPRDRYFILLFHDAWNFTTRQVNMMHQQARAGRDAKAGVRKDLAPRDWVAVLSWDGSLALHQDFTQDRGEILDAIDQAASRKKGSGDWPSRREMGEGPSLARNLPPGRELRRITPTIYDAFAAIAHASRNVRGRKNLVYFGIGFGDVGPRGQYKEDPRYFPEMVRRLNDANVAVYPIDMMPSGVEHPFEQALMQVAQLTGGITTPLASSFKTPLEKVSGDATGYYLLAYRATHGQDEAGFQRVRVETDNPAFQVRSRVGYLYGNRGADGSGETPEGPGGDR